MNVIDKKNRRIERLKELDFDIRKEFSENLPGLSLISLRLICLNLKQVIFHFLNVKSKLLNYFPLTSQK